jgi:predicted nucleic acid-binding protein
MVNQCIGSSNRARLIARHDGNDQRHLALDCFYLALALLREAKLITSDTHFHRKAVIAGYQSSVSLLEEWAQG